MGQHRYTRRSSNGLWVRRASLFPRLLDVASGGSVFQARRYVEDGTNPGFVLRFVDWLDATHYLEQATAARQVALPVSHADYDGDLCATFVTATQNYYVSTRAASTWAHLHSGSGMSITKIFTPTVDQAQTFLSTHTTGAATGMLYRSTGAAGDIDIGGLNAVGGAFVYQRTVAAAIPAGTPTCLTVDFVDGATTESELYRRGTLISSGTSATAVTTNAPPASLNLGRRANNTGHASMRWHTLIVTPGRLSAADMEIVKEYARALGLEMAA